MTTRIIVDGYKNQQQFLLEIIGSNTTNMQNRNDIKYYNDL